MPHGLHLAYLTRLQRLTLLNQAVYGLQASTLFIRSILTLTHHQIYCKKTFDFV
jgi:hypothetical protein